MQFERRIPALMIALWVACLPVFAGGDVNVFVGQREADEDRFDDVGLQGLPQFGVTLNLGGDWPVAVAVDLFVASDDTTRSVAVGSPQSLQFRTDVDTLELDLGVRKLFDMQRFKPFIGGGVAWVQLDIEQIESGSLGPGSEFSDTILDDSDSAFGFWVDVGFLYRIGNHFNIGVDIRYSRSDVQLTPVVAAAPLRLESGGTQYGAVLGYHW